MESTLTAEYLYRVGWNWGNRKITEIGAIFGLSTQFNQQQLQDLQQQKQHKE